MGDEKLTGGTNSEGMFGTLGKSFLTALLGVAGTVLGNALWQRWKDRSSDKGPWECDVSVKHNLYGRDRDVKEVLRLLRRHRHVAITGPSGAGKTDLAVRCAHEAWHRHGFPGGVFFIEAANGLESGFKRALNREGSNLRRHVVAEHRADSLLVIDDLRDATQLNQAVGELPAPNSFNCSMLVTNWGQGVPSWFVKYDLPRLERDAALQLLLQNRPEVLQNPASSDYTAAVNLCRRAANLPRILATAAAYLGKQMDKGPADFLHGWREQPHMEFADLSKYDISLQSDPDFLAYLEPPWACTDAEAREILCLGGLIPPVIQPMERFRLLTQWPPVRLKTAFTRLKDYGLLEIVSDDKLFLHTHVHNFAREKARATLAGREVEYFRNLVEAYDRSPSYLAERCIHPGPASVQEDLDAGCQLVGKTPAPLPGEAEAEDRRQVLVSFLQHEDKKVRENLPGRPNGRAAFVLQQLLNWATDVGEEALADRSRVALVGQGPYFRLRRQWRRRSHELTDPPLLGHRKAVNAVALTPDGRRCVTGSDDYDLRVWDIPERRELFALAGHERAVWAVSLDASGAIAASASDDRTVRVWDLSSGQLLRKFAHDSWVNAVALTPDGRYAISGADDGYVRVWSVDAGRVVEPIVEHRRGSWVLALALHGRRIVSASQEGTLKVWEFDPATGRVASEAAMTLRGHGGWVRGVAISQDGRYAVSASLDSTLRVWDLESGESRRVLAGHRAPVRGVAVRTIDLRRVVVSGSDDETLKVWDLDTGKLMRTFCGHSNLIRAVAVGEDASRPFAISASCDGTVRIWDLADVLHSLGNPKEGVRSVAFDGPDRAVVKYNDGNVAAADLREGSSVSGVNASDETYSWPVAAPMLSARPDGSVEVRSRQEEGQPRRLKGHRQIVTATAISRRGSFALSASADCTLKLWDLKECQELCSVVLGGPVTTLALGSDDRTVLAGDEIGNLYWLRLEGWDDRLTRSDELDFLSS